MEFIPRQYRLNGSAPEHAVEVFGNIRDTADKLVTLLSGDAYPHGRDFVGRSEEFDRAKEYFDHLIGNATEIFEVAHTHQMEAAKARDARTPG